MTKTIDIELPDEPVAHSPRKPANGGPWHALLEHSTQVATLAGEFARPLGLGRAARLIGMWHDAGKASARWQKHLLGRVRRPDDPYERVPHAIVGAWAVYGSFATRPSLGYAPALSIACHHTGLIDRGDFLEKLRAERKDPDTLAACDAAHALFDDHAPITPECVEDTLVDVQSGTTHGLALRVRMLHSCLLDADSLDTERHFSPDTASRRGVDVSMGELWARFEANHEAFVSGVDPTRELNARRAQMYQDALDAAKRPPGFYSLTMPTGAGKTRAGMAFALKHAATHGQRRVIVAIPFTSIIEQNAATYREILGEHAVLEHHSATHIPLHRHEETSRELDRRLCTQNWDAPVVVTTNVQFFESLFSSRNRRLRKLHNIAGSVVVLDEVQTLPPHLLYLTLMALRRLVDEFGCTIVFSTATQPAFTDRTLGIGWEGAALGGITEIITDPHEHFDALRRVDYRIVGGKLTWGRLAERLTPSPQVLCIVNTVAASQQLLAHLRTRVDQDRLFALSSRLCPAHRREVLDRVRERLADGLPCVLVSTQVVEAGVDIDFPVVWRARAPLDAIIQAAGRCNREGLLALPGRVCVFTPEEAVLPGGAYTVGTYKANELLSRGCDLGDPDTATDYFAALYMRASSLTEQQGLIERELALDFNTVDEGYRLIEDDQTALLIRRDDAPEDERDVIATALAEIALRGLRARDLRVLSDYMVALREGPFEDAFARGLITRPVPDEDLYEWVGDYDALLGLTLP